MPPGRRLSSERAGYVLPANLISVRSSCKEGTGPQSIHGRLFHLYPPLFLRNNSINCRGNREGGAQIIHRAAVEALESRTLLSSISGAVFRDANGDGVQKPTEVGVANCTVYLDVNNSGSYQWNDPSTNSDSNGNYTLTLPIGSGNSTVVIGVLPPSGQRGWQSTNANTISVNVPDDSQESQDLTGTNFGLLQVGAVAGTVFNDSNNNGAQDYGESGLSYCLVYYDPTGQGYYNWNDPQATTGKIIRGRDPID